MYARKFTSLVIVHLAILSILLTGCDRIGTPTALPTPLSPTSPPVSGEEIREDAQVESVEALLLESFPVQVSLEVKGALPDSCTEIVSTNIEQQGQRFLVLVTTGRPAGKECAQVIRPFTESIPLDVLGLPAGTYQVLVNGVESSFTLDMDNAPPTQIPEEANGIIKGRVWHDLCAVAGGEGGEPAVPSAGCLDTDSGFIANGILEAGERGIPEVKVELAQGECPGTDPVFRITGADGDFAFTQLPAGDYCLFVNSLDQATNEPLLVPGGWTEPSVADPVSTRSITLEANAVVDGQNFGWDYQFLPEPEETASCTNLAKFVTDVSIPDNTTLAAGDSFKKTWRLRNAGTCTWSEKYALVFDSGDRMGGPASANLASEVLPDETVDISVDLTAPTAEGAYEGLWRLQTPQSVPFGIGEKGDKSFWVRIRVGKGAAAPALGTPAWRDDFSSDSGWARFEDEHTEFEVDDGVVKMTAKNPDWWNGWVFAPRQAEDLYLQAEFKIGACSGYDHYGLIFRAPDAEAGYLYTVSCHGYYTLWRWDGETMNIVKEWARSTAIKAGEDQTNTLLIKVDGDTFTLYINGAELATVVDDTLDGGRFGLFVGSAETEDLVVEVDEIAYWVIDD